MRKVLYVFVALGTLFASAGIAAPYSGNQPTGRGGDSARVGIVGVVAAAPTATAAQTGLRMPTVSGMGGVIGGTTTTPAATTTAPAYSIDNCMEDLQICVEGALPKGIRAMYNSDMRNNVISGMNLCGGQIEKCIHDAKRLDGKNAYNGKGDVWIDFNSRIIQPSYYAFVLRRTGLTPNQAENTCMLIDKNTSGSSFESIADEGSEEQLGYMPDSDTARGRYARWDATEGDCQVRIAACNTGATGYLAAVAGGKGTSSGDEDCAITNEWLWGAAGDKQKAEVWKSAGELFKCAKELFGFNLMNATSTMAVVGIGGGTVVGATVGALASNKKVDTSLNISNCQEKEYRDVLAKALKKLGRSDDVSSVDSCRIFIKGVNSAGGLLTSSK
ncbi:MAG: hypothetical protein LBT45_02900 [Rickettsiales bacterium]|jgi:hypothetical protein|nr:hypothetical protein [Rickettsiales bacterium]